MRFIAALMVFADHAAMEVMFDNKTVGGLTYMALNPIGPMGVSFFFILSGFVLMWSATPDDTARAFWRRRAAKILPNHIITWAAGLVLLIAAAQPVGLLRTLPSLLLVHPWIPSEASIQGTNASVWSLACEVFFYLCFPLLALLFNRIREDRLWRWTWAFIVATMAVPYAAKLLPATPKMDWSDTSLLRFWFVYELPAVRLLEFSLGILLARLVISGRWKGVRLRWALALLVPAYFASLLRPFALSHILPELSGVTATFVIPLVLVIGATATADIAGRRTWASSRLMVWLGEASFAFYLIHWLVLHYGRILLFGPGATFSFGGTVLFVSGVFAVSLLLTWALYTLVERPLMRRWSRPHPRAAAAGKPQDHAPEPAAVGPATAQASA
ncbi:acyltransferase [Actinoplanes sp. NPDC049548]|uniref:acyltransferase family protein n=1 Tax=Actinoplanes sp. NPDC049548 TaxID=3155152 RepID=UPI003432077A